jgi:5-methyltetrahydrofolate--homocysteine methyltransferase
MNDLEMLSQLVQSGKAKDVAVKVQELIDKGLPANTIINQGLLEGMNEVGLKWKAGKAFIPEVLITARALNAGMDLLQKYITVDPAQEVTVVIGAVKGDMHDIGKNLVGMMLKSKGLKVVDLGTNVDSASFISAVKEHHARYICMSALLTTTMLYFKTVCDDFRAAGLRDQVTILCGGAPVTEDFAKQCGCGYFRNDALACADLVAQLAKEHKS